MSDCLKIHSTDRYSKIHGIDNSNGLYRDLAKSLIQYKIEIISSSPNHQKLQNWIDSVIIAYRYWALVYIHIKADQSPL